MSTPAQTQPTQPPSNRSRLIAHNARRNVPLIAAVVALLLAVGVVYAAPAASAQATTTTTSIEVKTDSDKVDTDTMNDDKEDSDKTGLWGLVGLLGLAGLAGLAGRKRHSDDAYRTSGVIAGDTNPRGSTTTH